MVHEWKRPPSGAGDGTWTCSLPLPWDSTYAAAVAETNDGESGVDELFLALGADGWELVSAIDSRRDQFIETGGGHAEVSGHATAVTYVFKRLEATAHEVEQLEAARQSVATRIQVADRRRMDAAAAATRDIPTPDDGSRERMTPIRVGSLRAGMSIWLDNAGKWVTVAAVSIEPDGRIVVTKEGGGRIYFTPGDDVVVAP